MLEDQKYAEAHEGRCDGHGGDEAVHPSGGNEEGEGVPVNRPVLESYPQRELDLARM